MATKKKTTPKKRTHSPRAPKPEIGSTSRAGVVTSNPELEALIADAPNDAQRYLVYADWLQEREDPRGELIIVQHQIAAALAAGDMSRVMRLEDMEAALFKKFETELLGDLAAHAEYREKSGQLRKRRGLAWRFGFVRAIRLDPIYNPDSKWANKGLKALLAHPSGKFVEAIAFKDMDVTAAAKLCREKAPKTVRVLMGESWWKPTTADRLLDALPNVRRVKFNGASEVKSPDGFAQLEEIEAVDVWRSKDGFLQMIADDATQLPSLKKLSLMNVTTLGDQQTKIALSRTGFPNLEELHVRRWREEEGVPAPHSELAHHVIDLALERKLKELTLEMPFDEDGMARLVARMSELARIPRLSLVKVAIFEQSARKSLEKNLPNLTWLPLPEEEEIGDIEGFHHGSSA